MKSKRSSLNEQQLQILVAFIKEFLPPRGNRRKNTGNEIETVQRALDKIFKKYFSYSVSFGDVLDAFK